MSATVLITGNTFPVKDSIRALGGRWDAAARGWRVPAARAAEAEALVSGAGAKSASPNYDPTKFNGYGARRGGFRKACISGGNCSSFGSGRSCGGHDCDGF